MIEIELFANIDADRAQLDILVGPDELGDRRLVLFAERSMLMARSRFLCCERSFWQLATRPVARCVMRTAESVVLTCCPPLPLDR